MMWASLAIFKIYSYVLIGHTLVCQKRRQQCVYSLIRELSRVGKASSLPDWESKGKKRRLKWGTILGLNPRPSVPHVTHLPLHHPELAFEKSWSALLKYSICFFLCSPYLLPVHTHSMVFVFAEFSWERVPTIIHHKSWVEERQRSRRLQG